MAIGLCVRVFETTRLVLFDLQLSKWDYKSISIQLPFAATAYAAAAASDAVQICSWINCKLFDYTLSSEHNSRCIRAIMFTAFFRGKWEWFLCGAISNGNDLIVVLPFIRRIYSKIQVRSNLVYVSVCVCAFCLRFSSEIAKYVCTAHICGRKMLQLFVSFSVHSERHIIYLKL